MNLWFLRIALAATISCGVAGCGGGGSGGATVLMATPYGAGWESPAKPPTVAEQSVEKQKALSAAGIPSTIDQCVTVSPDRSPLPEEPITLTLGDGGIGAVLSTYMLYQIPQGYVASAKKLGLTEVSITGGNLVGVGRTINPNFFDCNTQ